MVHKPIPQNVTSFVIIQLTSRDVFEVHTNRYYDAIAELPYTSIMPQRLFVKLCYDYNNSNTYVYSHCLLNMPTNEASVVFKVQTKYQLEGADRVLHTLHGRLRGRHYPHAQSVHLPGPVSSVEYIYAFQSTIIVKLTII